MLTTIFVVLLLFFATYGIAWGLTQSGFWEPVRAFVEDWPFVGPLLQCIVCTGFWVALGLVYGVVPWTTWCVQGFSGWNFVDLGVLVFALTAGVWMLATRLGDAD